VGLHILRHSIATHLLEAGMTLEEVSQVLELKPFQVLELYVYLNEVRPRILEWISDPKPFGIRPDKINTDRLRDQLFISVNGSEHIKNSLLHLFRLIRKTYLDVMSAQQVRQSAIFHWLKDHNLREVQYMAGPPLGKFYRALPAGQPR
jgi:integrase/recombinase XerD